MSFTAEPHVPPLPLDFRRIWDDAEWLSPAEFGVAMILLAELWQAPGHRVRYDGDHLSRLFSNGLTEQMQLSPEGMENVLHALFWYDPREGFIYSRYILELVGRPTKRAPIPRWMKDAAARKTTTRAGVLCYYCHEVLDPAEWHFDHQLPISRGGINHPHNLVVSCAGCNATKGAMTDTEFWARQQAQWAEEVEEGSDS